MARDAMLWMLANPHRAVALLDAGRDASWARSELSDIIREDRRRRGVYVDAETQDDMPANIAVNLCIELLQGDIAVLLLVAATGGRLHSLCQLMISAHVRQHLQQTGEEIRDLKLYTDGVLHTDIHVVTRRMVDAVRTGSGACRSVMYRWRDVRSA